jgi:subtilisin family serine protease
MKRTFAVFSLILTTTVFAQSERYLVATKHRPSSSTAMRLIFGEDSERHSVMAFETFTGFAANLTDADVTSLRASDEVRWVERVVERHAFAQQRIPFRQTVPLGLDAIFARQPQGVAARGAINVVVIDTGIDHRHPDLQPTFAGGRNLRTGTNDPFDDNGHGTHVAGTIAAADNAFGVVGIAPKARLWSVKALDSSGQGTSEDLLEALDWVAEQKRMRGGNWIITLSLGSTTESIGEREAFQRISDEGILVIAAAGNLEIPNAPPTVAFPAAYPSVIAVVATTFDRKLAYFSSQGPEVDFAAPGVNVLSTLPLGSNDLSYVIAGDTTTLVHDVTGSAYGIVTQELVYCGTGKPGDFPSTVAGRIALIKRGDLVSFADKTRRAKEAGAIAVAIFDNVYDSSGSWTLYNNDEDRAYDWPVTLQLTRSMGEALLDSLIHNGSHPITIALTHDDYGEISGTSMAASHVAGAAALVWALAPGATAQQVINALSATAIDLGPPGPDPLFGMGFINANAAARLLAPQAFGITTGRPIGRRGRGH